MTGPRTPPCTGSRWYGSPQTPRPAPTPHGTAAKAKSKKDILRTLKRAIAREVFHLITSPPPVQDSADLRPARQRLGLSLTNVAKALDCAVSKISLIERGTIRDTRFLHHYRAWLTEHQPAQTAA